METTKLRVRIDALDNENYKYVCSINAISTYNKSPADLWVYKNEMNILSEAVRVLKN